MNQPSLFDDETISRNLLTNLLDDSLLYHKSDDFKALLDFTIKLRNVAPFNAMLLHIQKPGIQHVASKHDWLKRYGRTIRDGARPLLILVPFGPVALVYDVQDTEGAPLPKTVENPFPATGTIQTHDVEHFCFLLGKKNIDVRIVNYGSGKAGDIQAVHCYAAPEEGYTVQEQQKTVSYIIHVNSNHDPNVQFTTLAHELAHLFLGHLGGNKQLGIASRSDLNHAQVELEAESTAYLICKRNGVHSESEVYLSDYVNNNRVIEGLDLYNIMKAAGHVETVLGLTTEKMSFGVH